MPDMSDTDKVDRSLCIEVYSSFINTGEAHDNYAHMHGSTLGVQ